MMNNFKTFVLILAMSALILWVGHTLGGFSGLMIAFAIALVFNLASFWFSDKMVVKLYGCREISPSEAPRLHEMVSRLSKQAGIPMPRVLMMDNPVPNAFATGRDPAHSAVAVTTGLLQIADHDEVEGVIAHELSHIKHRDTLTMMVVGMMAMMIMFASRFAFWFGDRNNVLGSLLILVLAPVAAILIQMAISRNREYEADAGAARITGSPRSLANALAKLENVNKTSEYEYADPSTAHLFIVKPGVLAGLGALFSTHPPISERIKRLTALENRPY